MSISRRAFVQRGAAAAALATLPGRRLWALPGSPPPQHHLDQLARRIDAPLVRELALKAVDAAKAAGAQYADVRLTRTVGQDFQTPGGLADDINVNDSERLAVGVRALFNGYWGFAASTYWDPEEMPVLAQQAVGLAKINARGTPRTVDLGTIPVPQGTWTTPGRDPLTITIEEKVDFLNGWRQAVEESQAGELSAHGDGLWAMGFNRSEHIFASTEGAYTEQTFLGSGGGFQVKVQVQGGAHPPYYYNETALDTGFGGDLREARVKEGLPELLAEADRQLRIPTKDGELGRYDLVCSAGATASLLQATFGQTTALDRASGYEVAAGEKSAIGPDPMYFLGATVAAPLLNVTALPSVDGKWDAEGVEPVSFPLIRDGVLVDYQTMREQAGWLKPYYEAHRLPQRSHGGAAAGEAMAPPAIAATQMSMQPGRAAVSFDDMIKGVKKGIAIGGAGVSMDFQRKTGVLGGAIREINNGQLGANLHGIQIVFNAVDLWRSLVAIGGPAASNGAAVPTQFKPVGVTRTER